jgi:hypothetical protein
MQSAALIITQKNTTTIRLLGQPMQTPTTKTISEKEFLTGQAIGPAGGDDPASLELGHIHNQVSTTVSAGMTIEMLKDGQVDVGHLSIPQFLSIAYSA